MTVARTTLLDLPIITTGTESGLWGDYTNNGLTQYLDIAIAGMSNLTSANFTAGALTIETTEGTNSATNIVATSAQYAGFRVSSLAVNSTITVGNTGTTLGRSYRLINADSTYTLTFKATGQTGITLKPGQSAVVAFNGTDYVLVGNTFLADSNAFTGANTFYNATGQTFGTATSSQDGIILAGRGGGTSSYRVTLQPTTLSANRTLTLPNVTDTVATIGTAQTFTAAQTFRAANAIRSEAASTQDAVVVAGRAGGTSSRAVTITPTTLTASRTVTLPDADTTIPVATQVITFSGPTAARTYTLPDAASTLAALATAQTFTALQTFSGSTSVAATKLANAKEVATISATAATGTINYDITTQSVLYYTSNASANWTVNFRGSSGTSLDTLMSTGESMTVAFLVTQGATAYYNSAVQVDGSSVTPKYQGGGAWSTGNASSIDAYVYTIVKTGSAAFTVFASQTRFA